MTIFTFFFVHLFGCLNNSFPYFMVSSFVRLIAIESKLLGCIVCGYAIDGGAMRWSVVWMILFQCPLKPSCKKCIQCENVKCLLLHIAHNEY